MALIPVRMQAAKEPLPTPAINESPGIRWSLIAIAFLFLGLFLAVPLFAVFDFALARGIHAYFDAIRDPYALNSIAKTLIAAGVAVPANMIFGIAAAWAIAKFEFRGKTVLITLIDLPIAVSPVIAGMTFVLLFGREGILGPWLISHGIRIIFATPGIVLATIFVTFPIVARELIPAMQMTGAEEELAALSLGASGWQTFRRVTLPNVKWALLYGAVICNARAMGEFGAVSVVSGSIRGVTTTMPLYIELLYNEYHFAAAFTIASLLTLLALVTLLAKWLIAAPEQAVADSTEEIEEAA
jgi:sulfate/thiosulfate transport system permease protein